MDWGEILCCCVVNVKQLVMSKKGRISEEIRSKDHLPTYRSWAGFRRECGAQAVPRPKKGKCFWPVAIKPYTIPKWKRGLHLQLLFPLQYTCHLSN